MPDEIELSRQVQVRSFHRDQAAATESIPQRQSRNAAYPQAGFHGALDGFGVFQFEADIERTTVMAHGLVERQARA
ncbi:hypothetical protein D3C76_1619410 [compost metagenome]